MAKALQQFHFNFDSLLIKCDKFGQAAFTDLSPMVWPGRHTNYTVHRHTICSSP